MHAVTAATSVINCMCLDTTAYRYEAGNPTKLTLLQQLQVRLLLLVSTSISTGVEIA
jgi:hypothetical protein